MNLISVKVSQSIHPSLPDVGATGVLVPSMCNSIFIVIRFDNPDFGLLRVFRDLLGDGVFLL